MRFGAFFLAFVASESAFSAVAHATTPTLSLSASSPGYTQLIVNGDANSSVSLYYYIQAAGSETVTSGSLGVTNSYGYFSTTLNNSQYNIPYNAPVYVSVNGTNSPTVPWPASSYSNGAVYGGLSLSPSSATVQIGQTVAVTASNYINYGTLSIANNSNPTAISATVFGNQINITGAGYGSATITICQTGSNTCGTVYATVPSPGISTGPAPIYSVPISLSMSNVSLNAGTSQNVQIYGSYGYNINGYNSYYIYRNSNPAVVTATLNGSWLSLYGIGPGTSNITICQNNGTASCAQVFVNVVGNPWQPFYYAPITYPIQQFFSSVVPWW